MSASFRWRVAQFLELHWWRRYLRGKDPVNYLNDKRAYWQRVLNEVGLEPKPGVNSLDAGCGPAGIFILLHEVENVTALDPLLDHYHKNLGIFSHQDYPAVNFITGSLETTSLDNVPFDTIYCFNAINHVADWERSFDRLTKWAAPGTLLVISSDVHRRPWLLPIFRALPGDALHPQQHAVDAYRNALAERGWRVTGEYRLRREWIFDYYCGVAVLG
jgi:2-polyprenyl-6-hydroxyphenyl methylase/3-demethylubiquinone-9 3-methyltransferase